MKKPEKYPKQCNICKNSNTVNLKTDGTTNYYECYHCGARTGVDEFNRANGLLANDEMRSKREQCHNLFDPVWQNGVRPRRKCYDILAKKLGIPRTLCHFSYFDIQLLDRALDILEDDSWYSQNQQSYCNNQRMVAFGRRGQYGFSSMR